MEGADSICSMFKGADPEGVGLVLDWVYDYHGLGGSRCSLGKMPCF